MNQVLTTRILVFTLRVSWNNDVLKPEQIERVVRNHRLHFLSSNKRIHEKIYFWLSMLLGL